ncbi:unnamed protein product [Auanema sp. JU1783]|nr:unnamed protein product [Auanema sp. JU1783]
MTLVDLFNANGYAVIEDVFTEDEIAKMKCIMKGIVDETNFDDHPKSVFTTIEEKKHASDEYFLNSSDKIRIFFEEGALDEDGKLVVDKQKALNKIGHGLHFLNPVFREITFHPKIKSLFEKLKFEQPAVVQSMYIFKQPKIGGMVTDHFDATYLYVEPIDHLIGVWIAVDDATIENGCLSFIPGSHKQSSVDYRFVRTHDTTGGPLLTFNGERPVYDQNLFVPVPIKKGSLILIHGLVVHKSEANRSDKSRHAYTFHVMEKKNTAWSPDNWLQRPDGYEFKDLYTF